MNDAEAPNAAEAGSHSVSPACLCALLGCACVSVAVKKCPDRYQFIGNSFQERMRHGSGNSKMTFPCVLVSFRSVWIF